MTKMTVDFSKITGPVKAMHAVGQPPFLGSDYSFVHYLGEANIPYSRLHDTGGPYGGSRYVDIHNVFPNFDADETNPDSYDFLYTDLLIAALMENNCPPIFRLGETIENDQSKGFPPRYINPPKDFVKWARVCEHIIRHYNHGWANGFEFGIKYWEIWYEPDNGFQAGEGPVEARNQMWSGTYEEYYELYSVTALHLRECFGDSIKIGGYASSGLYAIFNDPEAYGVDPKFKKFYRERYVRFLQFFDEFLAHVKKTGAPLDFYSWHSYSDVDRTVEMANYVDRKLKSEGFTCEQHCNEWNNAHSYEGRGTSYANAHAVAMMLGMHDTNTDVMCYYDARLGLGTYAGMFNPERNTPYCLNYGFKAFGNLYQLGNAVACEGLPENVYGLAATDGKTNAVLLANIGKAQEISTDLVGYDVYLIDQDHFMTKVDWNPTSFVLGKNDVIYLEKAEA